MRGEEEEEEEKSDKCQIAIRRRVVGYGTLSVARRWFVGS